MAKTQLPGFVRKYGSQGGLGLGDGEIPRLKLLQARSAEIIKFSNAREGEFWHSLIDDRLGSTLRICPIYLDWRFVLWRPREAGGGILARADDGKHWTPADTEFTVEIEGGHQVKWRTASSVAASGLGKRGSYNPADPKSPPAAARMYSIVCSFPDQRDLPLAVLTLQRADARSATKLISKLKMLRAPSFGVIVEMASCERKSPSGDVYHHAFEVAGPVEDKVFYEENFARYRFFMQHGLKVKDLESVQED